MVQIVLLQAMEVLGVVRVEEEQSQVPQHKVIVEAEQDMEMMVVTVLQ